MDPSVGVYCLFPCQKNLKKNLMIPIPGRYSNLLTDTRRVHIFAKYFPSLCSNVKLDSFWQKNPLCKHTLDLERTWCTCNLQEQSKVRRYDRCAATINTDSLVHPQFKFYIVLIISSWKLRHQAACWPACVADVMLLGSCITVKFVQLECFGPAPDCCHLFFSYDING